MVGERAVGDLRLTIGWQGHGVTQSGLHRVVELNFLFPDGNLEFARVVRADDSSASCFAIMKPLTLSEQDYSALIDGVKRLVDQYSAIGESRISASRTRNRQMAIACGSGPEPNPTTLPRTSE